MLSVKYLQPMTNPALIGPIKALGILTLLASDPTPATAEQHLREVIRELGQGDDLRGALNLNVGWTSLGNLLLTHSSIVSGKSKEEVLRMIALELAKLDTP